MNADHRIVEPVLLYLTEALNLTHPRFALAYGEAYAAEDQPLCRERERPFLAEFFHQLRHLWERGFPSQLGLGHLVLQGEPGSAGPWPDFLWWRLGEAGRPHCRLAAVALAFLSNHPAILHNGQLLAHYRHNLGYPVAVNIVVGRFAIDASPLTEFPGVHLLRFDITRWQTLLED